MSLAPVAVALLASGATAQGQSSAGDSRQTVFLLGIDATIDGDDRRRRPVRPAAGAGAVGIIASIRLQGCSRESDAAGQSRENSALIGKTLTYIERRHGAASPYGVRVPPAPSGGDSPSRRSLRSRALPYDGNARTPFVRRPRTGGLPSTSARKFVPVGGP